MFRLSERFLWHFGCFGSLSEFLILEQIDVACLLIPALTDTIARPREWQGLYILKSLIFAMFVGSAGLANPLKFMVGPWFVSSGDR